MILRAFPSPVLSLPAVLLSVMLSATPLAPSRTPLLAPSSSLGGEIRGGLPPLANVSTTWGPQPLAGPPHRAKFPHPADQLAPAPFVAEWSWPLDPTPEVLRPFEKPPQPWQRGHRGVDLAAPTGATGGTTGGAGPDSGGAGGAGILSPAGGIVTFAGTVVDRGVLSIDHGGGRISSFEPVSTDLRKGQRVSEGDVVAALAKTDAASGPWHCGSPCLHWGVRVDGEYVDPLGFVMDRRPSVLLPLEY